jgi:hypothetical protein
VIEEKCLGKNFSGRRFFAEKCSREKVFEK